MKGITVKFKNHPDGKGGLETFEIEGCLIGASGSPNANRPQILIQLPKADKHDVDGSFVNYDGHDPHGAGAFELRHWGLGPDF